MSVAGARPFRGLLASDVDSTFILDEVIELLAESGELRSRIAEITARAMHGELDFSQSLRARVAMLEGLPASVLTRASAAIRLREGARELVELAHARHWRIVLVSGGFRSVLEPLQRDLGIHRVVANTLEQQDGALTGKVLGEIVSPQVKARTVREEQAAHHIPRARTLVLGDGANDMLMMKEAALAVGVSPKPALRPLVDRVIEYSLSDAIELLELLDRGESLDGGGHTIADSH